MYIYFKKRKLEKAFNSRKLLQRLFGKVCADIIEQRYFELNSAETLEHVFLLGTTGVHQLDGDRKGEFAVDAKQPFRIIFIPNHDPVPLKEDGGFDLSRINEITIIKVEDYHGKSGKK